jgi:hypothetical protein
MKLDTVALAARLFAASAYAQGQPDFSKVEIKVTPLGNNTYMLEGQGGNVVAAVGNDGVIQVDGEFAPLHDKIKAAIDKASGGKPIKYLINTHFHGDHTGGNAPFAKDGTTIVAHKNLALRLEHGSTNGMSGAKTAPVGRCDLTKTYTTEGLKLGGRPSATVNHPPSAHNDTDSRLFPARQCDRDWRYGQHRANAGSRSITPMAAASASSRRSRSTIWATSPTIRSRHEALATIDIQKYHDRFVRRVRCRTKSSRATESKPGQAARPGRAAAYQHDAEYGQDGPSLRKGATNSAIVR